MTGLPTVVVIGTLVSDPEIKWTASGAAVANFTIASNDRKFDKDTNSWTDGEATFLRGSIWRQDAENLANTGRKGHRIIATGELRQRSWDDKDGQKRTVLELAATEVAMSVKFATAELTKSTSGGNRSAGQTSNSGARSTQHEQAPSVDDEPPF